MDCDENLPRRADDPLAKLTQADLGPLSHDELLDRIATLESEIARVRQHLSITAVQRANAEALFRR